MTDWARVQQQVQLFSWDELPPRLRPASRCPTLIFPNALQLAYVDRTGNRGENFPMEPQESQHAVLIPFVCFEFYLRWVHDAEWRELAVATVAGIAVDAFLVEFIAWEAEQDGKAVRDYQVIDGADPIWKNYKLKNGKYAGQLVSLTADEAARLRQHIR